MPASLKGRRVVLAGGAGGLGSATTQLLAAEGAALTVSFAHHEERARALSDIAVIQHADLTLADHRRVLLDQSPGLYGLVAFSGIPARGAVEETIEESFRVNAMGPLLLAREAAARMQSGGAAGAIVLIATMQAVALFPNSTAYAAAKAALAHGARILAKEMRGANIRVNVVAPGVMQAGMAAASIASGKYNRYLEEAAIPRFGEAGDIARAVRFLLEPDNYVTGQVLSVDGGITL